MDDFSLLTSAWLRVSSGVELEVGWLMSHSLTWRSNPPEATKCCSRLVEGVDSQVSSAASARP